MKFKKYLKNKRAKREISRKILQPGKDNLKTIYRTCLENITPVTIPLVLISQIQRSGGSLLSQLFDGHPEIYAHPDELTIGYPKKYYWPQIDLKATPDRWFEMLFEENVINHFENGYKKGKNTKRVFPFLFPAPLQRLIFLKYLKSIENVNHRDVFNAYMTSYFGAWLNYQNRNEQKNIITGFTPKISMDAESIDLFFKIYPDGHLISSIRSPHNWYPSAYRHFEIKGNYENIQKAMEQWKRNVKSVLLNKRKYGDRLIIIHFEDLVSNTQTIMKRISNFIDISYDDILLTPTFNSIPISGNTSFTAENPGIMSSTLERYKTLSDENLNIIRELTQTDYDDVLNISPKISRVHGSI